MSELTLTELEAAARGQGYAAEVVNTGGGVVALSLTVHGAEALVALDDGHQHGSTWVVALDGETRERIGEAETDELPVTSDADQTVRDAVAWVRHAVWGDALGADQ